MLVNRYNGLKGGAVRNIKSSKFWMLPLQHIALPVRISPRIHLLPPMDVHTIRKRDYGACRTINTEHMIRFMDPDAYTSLKNVAKSTWGADWTGEPYDNPPDQPNFGLFACVIDPGPTMTLDEQPVCSSQPANASVVATTDGNVKISYDGGISSLTSAAVVKAAAAPVETTVAGDVSIPPLEDHFDLFNVSLALGNVYLARDSPATIDHSLTSVETRASTGQACYAPLSNISCAAEGHFQFQIASSGWVWFKYNTPRGNGSDLRTQWALSIEQLIPDAGLRSTYISINATIVASRLIAVGEPVCQFNSGIAGQSPIGDTGGPPVYIYAAPLAVGILLVCGVGLFFWRRSRKASRRQIVEAYPVPLSQEIAPSISGSSGERPYDNWARKLKGSLRVGVVSEERPHERWVRKLKTPTGVDVEPARDSQTYSSGERRYEAWARKLKARAPVDVATVRQDNETSTPKN